MKKLLLCIISLLFISTTSIAQNIPFDVEHAPAPLFRCPIYDGPTDPSMQWNEKRGEWWMFYTQRRANVPNLQGVACVYGSKIGIAATKDNGRNWYYVGTANLPEPCQGQSTFWAPDIFENNGTYYMLVTFIPGIHPFWGGDCRMVFYKSKDLMNWKLVEQIEGTHGSIDASAFQMPDKTWKMWYKSPDSKTYTGISKNLKTWKLTGESEITDCSHEGPIVFYWKDRYWNIIDECNLGYVGLHCYESADAKNWTRNSTILDKPGKRTDDGDQGRHCDVVVIGDRAFIFYFTHPGRIYDEKGIEIEEVSWNYHRASIQIAELELIEGKMVCNRDKYAKK
ncbi:MAG: hypothetical protein RR141_03365 [Rikenellaceae bacterium]